MSRDLPPIRPVAFSEQPGETPRFPSLDARGRATDLVVGVLGRDRRACARFISELTPVIRTRVVRALSRPGACPTPQRQDVLDLIQEVFVALLEHDGKVLRKWDPERGMSLANYVGLVAEREVGAFLRSGRRSGWAEAPTDQDFFAGCATGVGPERGVASRELLERLVEALAIRLSARGFALFEALFLDQRDAAEVARRHGLSMNALYTHRSRIRREMEALRRELQGTDPSVAGWARPDGRRSRSNLRVAA